MKREEDSLPQEILRLRCALAQDDNRMRSGEIHRLEGKNAKRVFCHIIGIHPF